MDKENPKKDGDEEGEKKNFKDPAIISAISGGITAELPPDSLIEHRYSKEELLRLRKAPGAQKKPKCLDLAYYNAAGVWDPEPWHYSNKQAEAHSHENGSQGGAGGGAGGGGDDGAPPSGKQRSRPSDPRERIRKEQDGIVLSPQRRSFNSGCFVPGREPPATAGGMTAPGGVAPLPLRGNRAHSPLGGGGVGGAGGKGERDRDRDRDQPMQRRIGSGRILPWDYQEKTEENDFGYRNERGDRRDERGERNDRRRGGGGPGGLGVDERGGGDRRDRGEDRHQDDRFERRSFGRDFDGKDGKHRQQGRFNRRVSNESREEEPEWFSSGPISQNDTIELRGFDDPPEKMKKNAKNKRNINGDSVVVPSSGGAKKEIKKHASKESLIGKDSGRNSPLKSGNEKKEAGKEVEKSKETSTPEEKKIGVGDEECFNFDAMFKADSLPIPGLLSNGIESGDSAGSRFSRWFQRERSPPTTMTSIANTANQLNPNAESKRTSPQEQQQPPHHNLIRNLLGDAFNVPQTVAIPQPGDAESYFAPISPAANSHPAAAAPSLKQQQQQQQTSLGLIEMQQRAAAAAGAAKKEAGGPGTGKILSLEELEAPLRQGAPDKSAQNKASEEDKQQFNRLFSQMNTNGPSMMPPQQKPMSIMEMLSHSQQKDAAAEVVHHQNRMHSRGVGGGGGLQNMSEMSYKLQQVQNQIQRQQQLDMLSKFFAAGNFNAHHAPQQRASPLPDLAVASRELLNRPEAQAIMQGLKRGDITPQHLYQQLANPAMQPRHREMLVTILKMQPPPSQQSQAQAQQPPMVVGQQQQSQQTTQQPPPPSQAGGGGGGSSGGGGVGVVPSAVSPNFFTQQQLRVSPLTPNALHQRIPSPRELQVHTQNIMQRALIKKKLEEQEENYRKKQQQQQQSRGAAGSPAKSTASPTLAFMPTSVMRKMTADKDDSKDGKDKLPQGRPLTGLRSVQQQAQNNPQVVNLQQQQQQNWNHFTAQMKQPGRAIVKANNYQPGGQNAAEFFAQQQQAQQHRLMHQQQHLPQQQPKNYYNQQQQQQQLSQMTAGGVGVHSQQYPQLSQQQLRQQHQNVRAQHQQQQPPPQQQQPPQQNFQHPPAGSWMGGGGGGGGGVGGQQAANYDANHHRGDLSPTSDQLARWFSPDLLERARKGNLPSIPTSAVTQHALSLEEIERQTTPIGQH